MKYISLFIFSIGILLVSGCDRRPKGVLSESEMIQLIADLETAEVYLRQSESMNYNDSTRDKAVEWVLEKRGITKADFDSTMTWYGRNIDIFQELYAKVDRELAQRQKKATGEEQASVAMDMDDLWPYSRHLMISEISGMRNVVFEIPVNEIHKGDRLNLKMRLNGLDYGEVLLAVDYNSGLSAYNHQSLMNNNHIDISLQTDTAQSVKKLYGYVRVKDSTRLPVLIDSIALNRLPLDSAEYYRIHSVRKVYPPIKKDIPTDNDNASDNERAEDSKIPNRINDNHGIQLSTQPMQLGQKPLKQTNLN